MSIDQKDTYYVAVKVFLVKNGKLLIVKDNFGDWDLPGGRIKKDEFETPLERIIQRKMAEELGGQIKYSLIKPEVFMRHERKEAVEGNPSVRIFAIGYSATLESGEVTLSLRHTKMEWVDLQSLKPEEYFTGGWLKGVTEYLDLVRK